MPIHTRFETLIEDQPGPLWQALFARFWPGYRNWFLRDGVVGRPGFLECRRALRTHMPELAPTWERLTELAGGGDIEARFLSLWCPPPYISGCAQGVWIDPLGNEAPGLFRNYDFAPVLLEGSWLATRWTGQRVLAMGDCMWGALDGCNEAGLAASLSFGGRTAHGEGFGVPLVLRYLLEVAQSTAQAVKLLQRLPISASYSITLMDARADWATVFVAPDRPAEVTKQAAITNFQHQIEWQEHARATQAAARLDRLQQVLAQSIHADQVTQALLQAPLFQTHYTRGYGTLYSAVYRPSSGQVELHWPGRSWVQHIDRFASGRMQVDYVDATPPLSTPTET